MSDPCPRMGSSGQWSGDAVMVSSLVSGLVMVSGLILLGVWSGYG